MYKCIHVVRTYLSLIAIYSITAYYIHSLHSVVLRGHGKMSRTLKKDVYAVMLSTKYQCSSVPHDIQPYLFGPPSNGDAMEIVRTTDTDNYHQELGGSYQPSTKHKEE